MSTADKVFEHSGRAALKNHVLRQYTRQFGGETAILETMKADDLYKEDEVYQALVKVGGIAHAIQDHDMMVESVEDVLALSERITHEEFAVRAKEIETVLSRLELVAPLALMTIGFSLALAARYEKSVRDECDSKEEADRILTEAMARSQTMVQEAKEQAAKFGQETERVMEDIFKNLPIN